MSGLDFLINLAGAVALLLWGMRMVSTGVSAAFGSGLRKVIDRNVSNKFRAFSVGAGITALLQSSTATALLVSSFASKGLIATGPALAIMLGADVGTTIVAQILSFDISWLSPILLAVGVAMHFSASDTVRRQVGRLVIGLGLMLLSLHLIMSTSEPIRDSVILQNLSSAMRDEVAIALLLTALLTWMAHSSLAIVLLIMSLASSGAIPMPLALVMVLGANIGGVIAPVVANWSKGFEAQRVPVGNAIFKILGALIFLFLLEVLSSSFFTVGPDPARQVVNFHTFFNLGLALLFILFTDLAAKRLDEIFPKAPLEADQGRPRYLDQSSIELPNIALASAEREAVRMGNIVEVMLQDGLLALKNNDRKEVLNVIKMDKTVNKLHESIKLYVTRVTREPLGDEESKRATNILTFTTDLEHIGDLLENLMEMIAKKIKKKMHFSDDGFQEIIGFHERVANNLRIALGLFISSDVSLAKKLLEEKVAINLLERQCAEKHMMRLREGRVESIETSALHLDILRDLKRIHSHIVSISFSVLDAPSYVKNVESFDIDNV